VWRLVTTNPTIKKPIGVFRAVAMSNRNRTHPVNNWDLVIGYSLEFGHWDFRLNGGSVFKQSAYNKFAIGGKIINKKVRQSRKGRKGRRNKEMIQLAKERIERLFKLAELEALDHNFERADRYVKLARKIGMRYNVRCPKKYKRRFCKHCLSYILPDVNSRVRIRNGKIVIYCNVCSKYTRLPINKKVKIQQDQLTEKIGAE
jgi:ribonuclease P protein subunit RPR2